jgi:hypothetical protein
MKYFKALGLVLFLGLFALLGLMFAGTSFGDCVRGTYGFSTTLNPTHDTYLNVNATNYDTDASLNQYTYPADTPANSFIVQFDLSSLPSNAEITSADLSFYLYDQSGDSTYDMTSHQIINYDPVTSGATGATYDGVNAWSAFSGWSYPMGYGDVDTASDSVAVDTSYGFKTWDVTSIIQNWLDDPGSNYGILMGGDFVSSVNSYRFFRSTDYGTSAQWPKLDITYIVR